MENLIFIAEIGNNHNGDIDRAKRLIDMSSDIGCDVVKFQVRNFKELYRGSENSVEDLGVEYTKDLLLKYELPLAAHRELFGYCDMRGIEYMCTPWDLSSVAFLEELGVKQYKVASADFDNIELLDKLIETGKPLILSTGMSSDEDISERIAYLRNRSACFTILH